MKSRKLHSAVVNRCFHEKKIIPYLNDEIQDSLSDLAEASVVFLQVDEIIQLPEALAPFCEKPLKDVVLILHIDLVRGLAHDEAALRYIAEFDRVDGISTINHQLIAPARRLGFITSFRLFLKDTRSLDRGINITLKANPDAVELIPCAAAIEVAEQLKRLHMPKIGSGLIHNLNTIQRALDSGCCATSASNPELWAFNAQF